jgi:pseudouridine synthase
MKERIQKILANAGVASRRNIEAMVREGRVSVNGRIVRDLPVLIDEAKDKVEVDGELVRLRARDVEKRYYFLLNKPKGVYSTNVSQGEQVRAIDLLPRDLPARVYPVGRLDVESKGLLLLTNDGELTHHLTHPRYEVPKTYRAVVDGYIKAETMQELEKGMWMADKGGKGFKTGRSRIRVAHRDHQQTVLEVTLREGRNCQVRRILANLGHKVRDLIRIKMGTLTLEGLAPGRFRELTARELKELRQATEKRPKPAGGRAKPSATRRKPTSTPRST